MQVGLDPTVQVRRIPILPWGLVNAHLLLGPQGAVLVDAGLPGSEEQVFRGLQALGLGWHDVKLIVITHAHVDHAGNVARLREMCHAPVVAHEGDLPYYRRELPMTFCPSGWFGRLFLKTGLMYQDYRPFEPDILLRSGERLSLSSFGLSGQVLSTPGHTAGSLSIQVGPYALVGDLVSSGVGLGGLWCTHRAKSPPFEDSPAQVADALERLLQSKAATFFMGHGGPLPDGEVLRHIQHLRELSA